MESTQPAPQAVAKKPFLRSKTNIVQLAALGAIALSTQFPEFKSAVCEAGDSKLALLAGITLLARNLGSNIAVRKQKTE